MPDDEAKSPELDDHDTYLALRALIEQERELRNQVFTWFLALNGFLFTALGFSWNTAPQLAYVLGVLGVAASVSWTLQSVASDLAHAEVRRLAHKREIGDDVPLVVSLSHLLPRSKWLHWVSLLLPNRALPVMLGLAWAAVIAVRVST